MNSQREQAKLVCPVCVLLGGDKRQLKHRVSRVVTQRLAVGETFKHAMNCRYSQMIATLNLLTRYLATSKYFLSGFGTSYSLARQH